MAKVGACIDVNSGVQHNQPPVRLKGHLLKRDGQCVAQHKDAVQMLRRIGQWMPRDARQFQFVRQREHLIIVQAVERVNRNLRAVVCHAKLRYR